MSNAQVMAGGWGAEGRECSKCGQVDCGKHCLGKRRQSEGWCTRPAGAGTDHGGYGRCRLHGGSTRNHRNSLKIVEAKATRDLAELGYEPVVDPIAELFDLAGKFKALESSFALRVAELGDELRYKGKGPVGTEQLRAEVAMWERFLDRLAKILEVLARLNLDERMVRISEGQATLIGKVIEGVLDALGLSAEVRARAAEELPKQLRAVSGG